MRNIDRSLALALFIAALAIAAQASAFSAGISSISFGSLGCNTCHSGGSTPTVTLTGPTTVAPESTSEYTLKIQVTGSQTKGGLNVAATDGTLAIGGSASSGTRTIDGKNGLVEITHTGAKASSGGFVTFSFLWTAPSVPTSITMTGWGNAVDGSATNAGDKAAFAALTVTVGASPPPLVCDATPLPSCRKPTAPGKSMFQLKDNPLDNKDALTWSWNKGDATALSDFGDPVNGSTSYTLCIYDDGGPVMTLTAPPGGECSGKPCWAAKRTGFLYNDKDLTNDGLKQLKLTAGPAGKAKVSVKGKGQNLPMPALPFAQNPAVIVQLVNSDGMCWEADFSAPAKRNDAQQFNDKSD
jgi:hypothetical protein